MTLHTHRPVRTFQKTIPKSKLKHLTEGARRNPDRQTHTRHSAGGSQHSDTEEKGESEVCRA